ncbi:MAG: carboxypeptidase M32 [Pirellulaceae bacterium]
MTDQETFDWLRSHFCEIALLQSTADALEWDERTGMPSAAGSYRAEQVTLLRGMIHQRRIASRVGESLDALRQSELVADPSSDQASTIERLHEDYSRDVRLPQSLVESLARATVIGQQAWDAARKADEFAIFRPALETMIRLKRETASHLQNEDQSAYDALLHEFEPEASADRLRVVFAELREQLVPLVQEIAAATHQPDVRLMQRSFPVADQRCFSRFAAEKIGFDFERGRLDETSHPFCTNLGPDDCRILSRYEERWFPGGLFGTLHEAGHGLYEQGLRREWYGLPPGSFCSLGIHESQSRLWENLVGRSHAFWRFLFPHARKVFPTAFADATVDSVHFAVNAVRPSLIRVEADEATYNLHVIIRFELEQQLIGGELSVDDLPDAWDAAYQATLGVQAPSAADGVLQDVHWSAGLFGYFPTYTLGNIYAAQLFAAAEKEIGGLEDQFAQGSFGELLHWLREHVHHVGRRYRPEELIQQATGEATHSQALMASLRNRYEELYRL